MQPVALALTLTTALFAGQAPRPVTLISEVRAAIAEHDLARAEALVVQRRAQQGTTSEVIEAVSWLGRGALAEGQGDRAEQYAAEAQRLALAALGSRPIDEDAKLRERGRRGDRGPGAGERQPRRAQRRDRVPRAGAEHLPDDRRSRNASRRTSTC